jgi:hypothetical protein
MKKIYTVARAITVMLLIVVAFAACTKSTATPETNDTSSTPDAMPASRTFNIYVSNNISIGTATFSREDQGKGRVVINLAKKSLDGYTAPYQAMLKSSTLPTAALNPIDQVTGISDTYPIVSSNKGLTVGHDALMFMRDLQLVLYDRDNKTIATADIH